jgi:GNAT superfamily N-acetyltransferase
MKNDKINIIPYDQKYNQALLELEQKAVQGNWVKLEMARDSYLSRSIVFKEWRALIALGKEEEVLGAVCTAIVPVEIDGEQIRTASVFDSRIRQDYQGQGVGSQLLSAVKRLNEVVLKVPHQFYTAKAANHPTRKIAFKVSPQYYAYDFIYLTIPTSRRLRQQVKVQAESNLKPTLFDTDFPEFVSVFPSGLKVWHTFKTYSLRIQKINYLAKTGLAVSSLFAPFFNRIKEGYQLQFATLFDFGYSDLSAINEVLEALQKDNIDFLNIVCRKDDPTHLLLRSMAISSYHYYLGSTFKIPDNAEFKIDVRCL